jgi:hypothetical protein
MRPLERAEPRAAVARAVQSWKAIGDARRRRSVLPFDPIRAQAYGLLPPRLVARVRSWGKFPATRRYLTLELACAIASDEMPPDHTLLRSPEVEAGLRSMRWPPPVFVAGGAPPGPQFAVPPFRRFEQKSLPPPASQSRP